MLTPSFLVITSLLLGLISIRTLIDVIRHRRELFNDHFTAQNRQRLSAAAFFLLLPISVALHEAGHAIAVKAFGGQIERFGWYFFYGFVGYSGFFTHAQIFWIALAGNLVSVVLGLVAIAVAVFWPRRAPINYLLFVFGAIDLANALIFYPLLDFIGGFEGDWSTIYSHATPVLSGATGIIHGALLLGALVAWRSTAARRLYAERTGLRPDALRRVSRTQAAGELLAVGEALAASWRHPLRVVADANEQAAGVTLHWISNGFGRVVGAYVVTAGRRHIELHGGIRQLDGDGESIQRPVALIEGIPSPDQLTPALTRALDLVDAWDMQAAQQPI